MDIKKRSQSLVGWVCVGMVLFFAIHQARLQSPTALDRLCSYVLYPFLAAQSVVVYPFVQTASWLHSIADLQKEKMLLIRDRELLTEQLIQVQSLVHLVQETAPVRSYSHMYGSNEIFLAQVLTKTLASSEQSLYITGGSDAGIAPNMPVMHKNCVVGKIVQVFPWYSKVMLLTDARCHIGAVCLHSKAKGIFEGKNKKEEACLVHVSHLQTLQEGDMVISSGQGLVFPYGYGLGRIKAFQKEDLFYSVILDPLIDVSSLSYCYVLLRVSHEVPASEKEGKGDPSRG